MTTKNKVLLGILGAAAAGVVIGLLVAPDKGSDTRKKLRKTAGEWQITWVIYGPTEKKRQKRRSKM